MENTISAGGGMRFYPTDEELIRLYLLPKVAGLHLPLDGYVVDRDLYDRPPWEIFGDSKERVKYFFTKLKKKSKKRFNRGVGDFGTWHGSDNADRIFHGTSDIGRVKSFSFKNKVNSEHNNDKFLMKEYSLSEPMRLSIQKLFHNHKVDEEFVLCRIKRKKEKKDPSRDDIGLHNANEDDQHKIYEEMVLKLLNQSGSQGAGGVASQSIPCNDAVNSFATNTEFMSQGGGVASQSSPCNVAVDSFATNTEFMQVYGGVEHYSDVPATGYPWNVVNDSATNTEFMQLDGEVEHYFDVPAIGYPCNVVNDSEPLEGGPQLLASQEQQEGTMVWDDPNIVYSQATNNTFW